MRPIILGVAGGSGSGNTTVVREIVSALGPDQVAVVHHDSYYRDTSHFALDEWAAINYHHPDSLETELPVEHLSALRTGEPVDAPIHDFTTHNQWEERQRVLPRKVVIVDRLLTLWNPALRARTDIRVFVDTP